MKSAPRRILFLSLLGATLGLASLPGFAQTCASAPSGACAAGVSGQRCSAGNGNFGLCTSTDGNSSCDCMPSTLGEFTLSVGNLSPSAVHPGDSSSSTVTVASISQPSANTFFQGVVNLSCSTNGTNALSCSLNPAQVFVNGNSITSTLTVTTVLSLPLLPGGTPAGTYPITITAKGQFVPAPQNGAQSVSLTVTNSGGGGNIALIIFFALLLLSMLWRFWRVNRVVVSQ